MEFDLGDHVRVKAPFAEAFPGVYEVTDVVHGEDGSVAYILGENGGFDAMYLEKAE